MTILTVGSGQAFTTIAAAVNASQSGDTVDVQAGTYTNDFTTIGHDLTLQAIGGMVTMAATVQPPDGKAILDEGGAGVSVAIDGFAFTGAAVNDGNGAGIRYEGGTLSLTNTDFYGNQDGLLGAADPNGVIRIANSEFYHSGTGDGFTHNIYVGVIASFTLTDSFVHDESVGNEVKSRAATNTITNDRILDNASTASYEIDLPNGGNATISGNVIQQGANSQNSNIISYGEEGGAPSSATLSVTGNTILNDLGSGPALTNDTGIVATFANNAVYGFGAGALVNGPAVQSGNTALATEPALDQSAPYSTTPTPPAPVAPTPVAPTPVAPTPVAPVTPQPVTIGSGPDSLVVTMSEDYYLGDAQFTLAVDGVQVGGVQTTTAVQPGQTQAFTVLGSFGSGPHTLAVTFTNDAAMLPDYDRNLYVDAISYNGVSQSSGVVALLGHGAGTVQTDTFAIAGTTAPQPPTPTPTPFPPVTDPAAGLVLNVSEDAYMGDAQFLVTEDGQQIGGVRTATTLHGSGTQAIALGQLAAGPHTIGISFINDAYGGSPSMDRNLYVDGATYNGQTVAGAATLLANGTTSFVATGDATPAGGVVVNVAEDAWMGDAQFTLNVDGAQVGGVHTATALNALGQSQAFSLDATLSAGPHTVGVAFINDAYGGSPSTDRNLYVTGATLNGQAVSGASATLLANGTHDFTVIIAG